MTRITDIKVEPLNLPLTEPFEISLGTQHAAENVLVTIETADGTIGYGEGSPIPPVTGETQAAAVATAQAAADILLGDDVRDYRRLITAVRTTFPGMVSALFAVETAILDTYCRHVDVPLAALFGGGTGSIETDLTIPILPPDDAAERAATAADRGFTHLKVKTGANVSDDVARVIAIAEVAPEAELKVDANQGWTPKETATFASAVAEQGIELALIEQPVPKTDLIGLARTRDLLDVPVAADEAVFTPADAIRAIREDAADIINVKLGKSGPLGVMDIAAIAESANLELMVGCMLESAIGIRTSAHVVTGRGSFSYVDLDGNRLLADDVLPTEDDPTIPVKGPGHGVVPSELDS